jgi:hypothetical protein
VTDEQRTAPATVPASIAPFAQAVNHTLGDASAPPPGHTESGTLDMRAMSTPAAVRLTDVILGNREDAA